jgi:hypothetical protein
MCPSAPPFCSKLRIARKALVHPYIMTFRHSSGGRGSTAQRVLTMYSTIYGNEYGNVALGNSWGGLKLDLGNFNTEFFEGRNR